MTSNIGRSDQRSLAAQTVRACAIQLPPLSEAGEAFGRHFRDFADCKVLLIGDASHGTSEFYQARAEITKYMIQYHGFNIVGVEADWPDAEAVDRYVCRRPGGRPSDREPPFQRFPTWMWRNLEVQGFVEWLRQHNVEGLARREAVGFYGLDLYSMGTSIKAIIDYLDNVDSAMAERARERYGKLLVWAEKPQEYGLGVLLTEFKGYEKEVVEMLTDVLAKRLEYSAHRQDGDEFHSAEQNARLVAGE
jgi:erythromycin esterase-like protein